MLKKTEFPTRDRDSGKSVNHVPRAAHHLALCRKKLTVEFNPVGTGQVSQQEILVFLILLHSDGTFNVNVQFNPSSTQLQRSPALLSLRVMRGALRVLAVIVLSGRVLPIKPYKIGTF